MEKSFIPHPHTKKTLILSLAWVLFWTIPWGKLPQITQGTVWAFLTDTPRLALALILFIVPGSLLYLLIHPAEQPVTLRGLLPIGMTFSIAISSVIGLLGRILGMSFLMVKVLFILVGLIEILMVAYKPLAPGLSKQAAIVTLRSGLKNPPLLLAIGLATLMTFNIHLFFPDDATYLAYLNNWQSSTQLGFENLVHEVAVTEHFRFWLALFPMSQALLSELSGLSGLLLLGSYLELFLIPLAVISGYWFTRQLGLSRKNAGFASLFQVTLFAWMVGTELPVGLWFYQNMAEDKVLATFVIVPVFIILGLNFIISNKRYRWALFVLSGVSILFTHPIILFFASVILLLMALISLMLKQTDWSRVFYIALSILGFMFPLFLIRIIGSQGSLAIKSSDVVETLNYELFVNIVNERFYGLNPKMLQFLDISLSNTTLDHFYEIIRYIPVFIFLTAGILALFNLKKGRAHWYVLSCMVLISIATIPYTGWLLGMLIGARMLSRSTWFLPLGLGTVLIFEGIQHWVKKRKGSKNPHVREKISYTLLGLIGSVLFTLPILASAVLPYFPQYFQLIGYYKQMSQVGAYIDAHHSEPVMALGLEYTDSLFLPGVSSQVRMISFREENVNPNGYFMSTEEQEERLSATNILRSVDSTISNKQWCNILSKYDITLFLARNDQTEPLQNRVEACHKNAHLVLVTEELYLFEISISN